MADALDKMGEGAKNLANKLDGAGDSAAARTREIRQELSDEVKAQVDEIRGAKTGTDSIHDFIQAKYAPKAEEAKAEAGDALTEAAEGAKQAAEKAESAAGEVIEAMSASLNDMSEKIKDTFEQIQGDATGAVEAAKAEAEQAVAEAEAAADAVTENVEDAAEATAENVEAAGDKAKEIILEGPTAETLSEVFGTEPAEEPDATDAE